VVQLEEENQRLKQIVAEQALDIKTLKAITTKNWYGPRPNGSPPHGWWQAVGLNQRRVYRLVALDRNTLRYRSHSRELVHQVWPTEWRM
jgi:hypothetical protein